MHLYLPAGYEGRSVVPHGYKRHSLGYRRVDLVDHSMGSVHTGLGICRLEPGGYVDLHIHANEKGIYVLEGELEIKHGLEAFKLSIDDYALIPYGVAHAVRNSGNKAVRWFEVQAPQPKPAGGWQDTFFVGDAAWPERVENADFGSPLTLFAGHFDEKTRAQSKPFGPTTHRFLHKEFGAQQLTLMRGELSVGGTCDLGDHAVEESYLVVSGEVDLEMEGKMYHLRPGDLAWTGVGASHAFFNRGSAPVRWIETQVPQFPTQNAGRKYDYWDKLRDL